nr:MAG TPA: hypothetical protein [Caudoviricetes sp.]
MGESTCLVLISHCSLLILCLLTSHSCLATNKQILLKDEIKQYILFSKV